MLWNVFCILCTPAVTIVLHYNCVLHHTNEYTCLDYATMRNLIKISFDSVRIKLRNYSYLIKFVR